MQMPVRRRIVFDVSEEQYQKISRVFSIQGSRQIFYSYITDDIIALEQEHPGLLISSIINRQIKLTDFSSIIKEMRDAQIERFKALNNEDTSE